LGGLGAVFLGGEPIKAPRGDGTEHRAPTC